MRFFSLMFLVLFIRTISADEPKLSVSFLNKPEGIKLISDEKKFPYFSLLHLLEIQAKINMDITGKSLEDSRKFCLTTYQENILEFNQDEKNGILSILDQTNKFLNFKYPLFVKTPWKFVKVSKNIEGGLPHTRNDCIVFSERVSLSYAMIGNNQVAPEIMESLKEDLFDLLIHEQVHVLQRLYPDKFELFNKDLLKFQKIKIDLTNEWLNKNQVVNPDAPYAEWAYLCKPAVAEKEELLIPFLILANKNTRHKMPNDFRKILLKIKNDKGVYSLITENDGKPEYYQYEEVPEYTKKFHLTPHNNYHSHETTADIIAQVIALGFKHENSKTQKEERKHFETEYKIYLEWCAKELK